MLMSWLRRPSGGTRVGAEDDPQRRVQLRLEVLEGRTAPSVTTEFPVPTVNAQLRDIVLGLDGNIWFTESLQAKIGRIKPSGAITEFPVPGFLHATGITVGPDGNLWFTEGLDNGIGRINPRAGSDAAIQASIINFPILGPTKNATHITAGPDGNLWFIEEQSGQIGRITMAGVVTQFNVSFSGVGDITPGPDGNLWFTETSDHIGRINPRAGSDAAIQASIAEFAVTPGSLPSGITAGPDGNLWFIEGGDDDIGRITTAGVLTGEFPTVGGAGLRGITTGPDGRLYFAEINRDRIGRMTTTGAYAELGSDMSVFASPLQVAFGADGAVWYIEIQSNKIGRTPLTIGAVTAATAGPFVGLFDGAGHLTRAMAPFGSRFRSPLAVAVGDVNADGVPDIAVAPSRSGPAAIGIFSGVDGSLLRAVFVPPSIFKGGMSLAVGDENADGFADILVGTTPGSLPLVAEYSGKDGTLLHFFLPFPAGFKAGVTLASDDVNGDGFADIIVAPTTGGPPLVEAFSGKDGSVLDAFLALPASFKGSLSLAAGDVSGDGVADIIAGVASGGPPVVEVFNGKGGALLRAPFLAFPASFKGGVVVGSEHANSDKFADIVVSPATGQPPLLEVLDGASGGAMQSFMAFPAGLKGFFLAAGDQEDAVPMH
jgi:streptogramin lyase